MKDIRIAITIFLVLTVITGLLYPLATTLVAQFVFPYQANGSMIVAISADKEITIGSELIGQPFSDPGYFWSRLSATSAHPYDSRASSGSNYAPTNPKLLDTAKARLDILEVENKELPSDLLTSSGSGLDPHISPASANLQISRVAKIRGIRNSDINELVKKYTEERFIGLLGEPRVNVLKLNIALDNIQRMR